MVHLQITAAMALVVLFFQFASVLAASRLHPSPSSEELLARSHGVSQISCSGEIGDVSEALFNAIPECADSFGGIYSGNSQMYIT